MPRVGRRVPRVRPPYASETWTPPTFLPYSPCMFREHDDPEAERLYQVVIDATDKQRASPSPGQAIGGPVWQALQAALIAYNDYLEAQAEAKHNSK